MYDRKEERLLRRGREEDAYENCMKGKTWQPSRHAEPITEYGGMGNSGHPLLKNKWESYLKKRKGLIEGLEAKSQAGN